MMNPDPDLIAYLYPLPTVPSVALSVLEKSQHFVTAKEFKYALRGEREATEPLQENDTDECLPPHIELRFSNGPRTSRGFVFGRNSNCDCVLPGMTGVSNFHFAITYDDAGRLVIQDLGSTVGTQVTYAGSDGRAQGTGRRRDFRWIIGGDNNADAADITLDVSPGARLRFQIKINPYHPLDPDISDRIGNFRKGVAGVEDMLNELSIPTAQTTGTATPQTGPIRITRFLGQGAFGIAHHVWDATTGHECVAKRPWSNSFDRDAWDREAALMKRLKHSNIVRYQGYDPHTDMDPRPVLYLEYVSGGTLLGYRGLLSEDGCYQVASQLCSALEYLHEQRIAHRDIKTENILVHYWIDGFISVAFADFGLSKQNHEFKTTCGTWVYTAPEVYNNGNTGYNCAVDIWSLAVVLLDVLSCLPDWTAKKEYESRPLTWILTLPTHIGPQFLARFPKLGPVISNMLVVDPGVRSTAGECLKMLESLNLDLLADAATQFLQRDMEHFESEHQQLTQVANFRKAHSEAFSLQTQRGEASTARTEILATIEDDEENQDLSDIHGPSSARHEVVYAQAGTGGLQEKDQGRPLNKRERSSNEPERSKDKHRRSRKEPQALDNLDFQP